MSSRKPGSRVSGYTQSHSQVTTSSDDGTKVYNYSQSGRGPNNGYQQSLNQSPRVVEMAPSTVGPGDSISQVSAQPSRRRGPVSNSGSRGQENWAVAKIRDPYSHSRAPSSHSSEIARQPASEYGGSGTYVSSGSHKSSGTHSRDGGRSAYSGSSSRHDRPIVLPRTLPPRLPTLREGYKYTETTTIEHKVEYRYR
ncbi:hypothetical protein EAF00_004448 [Botryotinia globosa]|nr:hypothetical protein EAF00_004448 [Botryotinia globosa]